MTRETTSVATRAVESDDKAQHITAHRQVTRGSVQTHNQRENATFFTYSSLTN